MNFSELINRYLAELKCPAVRLAEAAELPTYSISRYRSGQRVPELGSEAAHKLAQGLVQLALEKGRDDITMEKLQEEFRRAIIHSGVGFDFDVLRSCLDQLVQTFGITLSDIAVNTGYSRSSLSRLRSGHNQMREPYRFVQALARYVADNFRVDAQQVKAAEMMGCFGCKFVSEEAYYEALLAWLSGEPLGDNHAIQTMLYKMDSFDLDEYMRRMSLGKIQIPTIPFRLPTRKVYKGMRGMVSGVNDFFRATVCGKSFNDVIIYNNFPIDFFATNNESLKKWMRGLGALLIKGLNVQMIHHLDRPFNEILVAMHGWIPLYMTGQITPYYLDSENDMLFHECVFTSGSAALRGEAIAGHHKDARFHLYRAKELVEQQQVFAADLLSVAKPLMEVYGEERQAEFRALLDKETAQPGRWHASFSTLPIYTISDALLERILERNRIEKELAAQVRAFVAAEKKRFEQRLSLSEVSERITHLNRAEFEQHPVCLDLARGFFSDDISYTFAEYEEHLRDLLTFAHAYDNYRVSLETEGVFRNIQIIVIEDRGVLVSKNKSPQIHFVMRHPAIIAAAAALCS